MEDIKSTRLRASVSKNSKGYSVDCAVEMVNGTQAELINQVRSLMGDLERIYPREA
jgi:hypothetical protein